MRADSRITPQLAQLAPTTTPAAALPSPHMYAGTYEHPSAGRRRCVAVLPMPSTAAVSCGLSQLLLRRTHRRDRALHSSVTSAQLPCGGAASSLLQPPHALSAASIRPDSLAAHPAPDMPPRPRSPRCPSMPSPVHHLHRARPLPASSSCALSILQTMQRRMPLRR